MNLHRASDTAVLIARSLVLAEATPALRRLLPDDSGPLTRRFLASAAPPGWFEFFVRYRWTRRLLFTVEHLFLHGIFLHYLVRKKRIAALVAEAFDQGCRQLVVLGAGLDTLAWRHTTHSPIVPCFELDHPATQAIKHRAFQNELAGPVLIPADLSRDALGPRLCAEPRFDSARPAVFVAEGLLMYLAPARVNELMSELASLAAPGSRLIFTFMETRPDRPLAFHNASTAVNMWLRARREPFLWGLARKDVTVFSIQHGWRLHYLSSPDELRATVLAKHGLVRAPLARGESIALLTKPAPP